MGRGLNLVWLVVVVGVLVLLGQSLGLYSVPVLRDLVPFGQPAPGTIEPTPTASIAAKPVAAPSLSPAASVACTPATPRFLYGTAALKALLGAVMGEPTECERVVDAAGNTEQKTSTGLAYYRARSNTSAFTNGFDHWALTATGVVHWTSDDLEPPPDAERLQ